MSNAVLATQIRVKMWTQSAGERLKESELGQGSAEYAGVIVVALALVGVLITAGTEWGTTITTKVTNKINELFGG